MLKEQAISLLTQVKEIILGSESWLDSTHQPIEEAFSMAIEALKQSTQTNVPNVLNALDTINRQTAIRWVKAECNPYGKPTLDFESGKKVIEHLERMPSAQPEPCEDTISRQMAVAEIARWIGYIDEDMILRIQIGLKKLPSAQPEHGIKFDFDECTINELKELMRKQPLQWIPAQPEITLEIAIDYLHKIGWLQEHDKEMYEMGLKEQLADDSDSYDSLIPSEQPEQKKGKWIYHEPVDMFECSVCGRQMVRNIFDYCPWCGARMEE